MHTFPCILKRREGKKNYLPCRPKEADARLQKRALRGPALMQLGDTCLPQSGYPSNPEVCVCVYMYTWTNSGSFPKLGVPTLFGCPDNKDYSFFGSILGSPYFGKLPISSLSRSHPNEGKVNICHHLPTYICTYGPKP